MVSVDPESRSGILQKSKKLGENRKTLQKKLRFPSIFIFPNSSSLYFLKNIGRKMGTKDEWGNHALIINIYFNMSYK